MKIKRLAVVIMVLTILAVTAVSVYAAGDVASAVESTWTTARGQTKTVVNNVVFPVLDLILAVFFFVNDFAGMSFGRRLLAALFQSVTTRNGRL